MGQTTPPLASSSPVPPPFSHPSIWLTDPSESIQKCLALTAHNGVSRNTMRCQWGNDCHSGEWNKHSQCEEKRKKEVLRRRERMRTACVMLRLWEQLGDQMHPWCFASKCLSECCLIDGLYARMYFSLISFQNASIKILKASKCILSWSDWWCDAKLCERSSLCN